MSKRVIYILGGTMAIAVISLIIIQMLSVESNIVERNKHFNTLVNNSLFRVVRRLEIEEGELEQNSTQLHSQIDQSTPSNGYDLLDEKRDQHSHINGPDNSDPELLANFRELTGEDLSTPYSYNQTLLTRKLIQERALRDRIEFDKLRSKVSSELRSQNIEIAFKMSVSECRGGGEYSSIFKDPEYNEDGQVVLYAELFPNDYTPQGDRFAIYFVNRSDYIIKNGGIMWIPPLILIIIIISIFVVTLRIILKQKKLSIIKNDFINNMTHELKTPISTISLASQMLKDISIEHSPKAIKHVSGIIYDESKRLSHQVEKVLQMAVFNEGRLKLKMGELNLNEIVEKVKATFELQVTNEDGEFIVNIDEAPAYIVADKVHITNVIFNLLDNAVKYSKEKPQINLSTKVIDKFVVITVKDCGIGIAREHQSQIFERFYRVPTGNVHNVKGFGLGLSYVKKIVDVHSGQIKVDSTEGRGTTFVINIPLVKKR